MTVRVRYAPSPTGLQHIGGIRTALYCYLFAKANNGKFVLRIEDTDLERSKREYEEKAIEDIHWCGLDYDEGPDKGGDFGPYRQSERLELYKSLAWELVEKGMAYPCFLTSQELEKLTERAVTEKKAPHFYHGQYRDTAIEELKKRVDAGDEFVIRFKNPGKKYSFRDHVRGEVQFPEDMVGDFVIMRSNGMPVYNFCCVVDDWKMQISHVFRAEEHLNNTVRQLMLYEAFGVTPPEFAHVSLLVGEDRQKLSKRHGATSVAQYRDQNYLPQALINYLCLLGWSHPDETDIFNIEDIVSIFDIKRFNKSPALYDIKKLQYFNGQHMRGMDEDDLLIYCLKDIPAGHPFLGENADWQLKALNLLKEKVNLPSELVSHLEVFYCDHAEDSEEFKEIMSWETTPVIREYIKSQVDQLVAAGATHISEDDFSSWMNHLKKELKIKGKPLFKGIRAVLTGQGEGPDLKTIIPMTGLSLIQKRLS